MEAVEEDKVDSEGNGGDNIIEDVDEGYIS